MWKITTFSLFLLPQTSCYYLVFILFRTIFIRRFFLFYSFLSVVWLNVMLCTIIGQYYKYTNSYNAGNFNDQQIFKKKKCIFHMKYKNRTAMIITFFFLLIVVKLILDNNFV